MKMPNENRCVCCGVIIPEGTQVCPICLKGVLGVQANTESYIKEKIKVFKQLCIPLTKEQIEHMRSLKTEIQVDNYAHDLIVGKGDE